MQHTERIQTQHRISFEYNLDERKLQHHLSTHPTVHWQQAIGNFAVQQFLPGWSNT